MIYEQKLIVYTRFYTPWESVSLWSEAKDLWQTDAQSLLQYYI